jgi:hypothetical protein
MPVFPLNFGPYIFGLLIIEKTANSNERFQLAPNIKNTIKCINKPGCIYIKGLKSGDSDK